MPEETKAETPSVPAQTQAEKDAAERVSKAARINDEVYARLHQPTVLGITDKADRKPRKAAGKP